MILTKCVLEYTKYLLLRGKRKLERRDMVSLSWRWADRRPTAGKRPERNIWKKEKTKRMTKTTPMAKRLASIRELTSLFWTKPFSKFVVAGK